jgi:hypothetical protein
LPSYTSNSISTTSKHEEPTAPVILDYLVAHFPRNLDEGGGSDSSVSDEEDEDHESSSVPTSQSTHAVQRDYGLSPPPSLVEPLFSSSYTSSENESQNKRKRSPSLVPDTQCPEPGTGSDASLQDKRCKQGKQDISGDTSDSDYDEEDGITSPAPSVADAYDHELDELLSYLRATTTNNKTERAAGRPEVRTATINTVRVKNKPPSRPR